jgi:hypothetical protein
LKFVFWERKLGGAGGNCEPELLLLLRPSTGLPLSSATDFMVSVIASFRVIGRAAKLELVLLGGTMVIVIMRLVVTAGGSWIKNDSIGLF